LDGDVGGAQGERWRVMPDGPRVTVTCDGVELLSWSFEFPQNTMREDTHVICEGDRVSGFVIKETIGPAIINTRGIERATRLLVDRAYRRRDDNLRDAFGG